MLDIVSHKKKNFFAGREETVDGTSHGYKIVNYMALTLQHIFNLMLRHGRVPGLDNDFVLNRSVMFARLNATM